MISSHTLRSLLACLTLSLGAQIARAQPQRAQDSLSGARVFHAELLDFDQDGLPDLYVVTTNGSQLLRNLGGGQFEETASGTPVHATGATPSGRLLASVACANSVRDKVSGACVEVSTDPVLGTLYPLGPELNISSLGRVGVGTTAPARTLEVFSAEDDIARFRGSGALGGWLDITNVDIGGMRLSTDGTGPFRVRAAVDGGEDQLIVLHDGQVTVNGSDAGIFLTRYGVLTGSFSVSGPEAELSCGTGNRLLINTGASVREQLVVDSSGNVGIHDLSPSNVLTIGRGAGNAIADGWVTYSSRRWKENIEPLEGALDKVRALRGVAFTWKEGGGHDIGMIAEEVGAVVPEAVRFEENGKDARSIDYGRLTGILVEALKEQDRRIQELTRRIEERQELERP
jgi:hypothetical protein